MRCYLQQTLIAKQHPSNSAHLMRRHVRGWSISIYQFLILTDLRAQFPTCATRGAGVVGTSTHPRTPNTTLNVMRHKRPSWTSPLNKTSRPRPFIACMDWPNLRHVDFYSRASKIRYPCLRRELPCSTHTPVNQTSRIEHGTNASKPSNQSPKIRVPGTLSNMQLGMSA
jgi:hypothetical protein